MLVSQARAAPRRTKTPSERSEGVFMSCSVGDTGIEPVTSSVSGKRATAAPIAQSDAAVLNYRYFVSFCEVETGFEPVWTALQAAA